MIHAVLYKNNEKGGYSNKALQLSGSPNQISKQKKNDQDLPKKEKTFVPPSPVVVIAFTCESTAVIDHTQD